MATNGLGSGKRQLPHFDDVIAYIPEEIDPNLPLRKLLEDGDNSMRQAQTFKEFSRPDMALRSFLKASIIALTVVPKHRDYLVLRDRRELKQLHQALIVKIRSEQETYDKIKADIKADNQRTGVQPAGASSAAQNHTNPTTASNAPPPLGPPSPPASTPPPIPNGAHQTGGGSPIPKPKPAPKPHALHGNAIKPLGAGGNVGTKTAQDLNARFAALRQDPRIKTHPIIPPRPQGPRQMPQAPKPATSIAAAIPELPKLPDAIYNPVRGTVSNEAAQLPSSTSRGLFSRTGSSSTLINTSTIMAQGAIDGDHVPGMPGSRLSTSSSRPSTPKVKIPDGPTITADELRLYISRGAQNVKVLIIDVRPREDFAEGHIMSQATICVERNVLLRGEISGDDIAESMILEDAEEQGLFERRAEFDLVVFHDQCSKRLPSSSSKRPEDVALLSLHRALVHLSYKKELKNPPKLLAGGIDAWTDILGSNALTSSSSASIGASRRPLSSIARKRYTLVTPNAEDTRVWQETLKKSNLEIAQAPSFHHNYDDVLRRFPDISGAKESMSSPVREHPVHAPPISRPSAYSDLPVPPTRPPPTVPRTSYSGLSHTADDHGVSEDSMQAMVKTKKTTAADGSISGIFYTGLNNPHNWCYANSSLQALRASPAFGLELAKGQWEELYKVPKKNTEKIEHAQLMTRMIANLFQWMNSGKMQVMKADTLMEYTKHLCKKGTDGQLSRQAQDEFGGPKQQDAEEFLSFLFDNLGDETNPVRNMDGQAQAPKVVNDMELQAAHQYWQNHLELSNSMIDKYFRGLEMIRVTCEQCGNKTYTWETFTVLKVHISKGPEPETLTQCLRQTFRTETIEGYDCDVCKAAGKGATRAKRRVFLARLPRLLCIQVVRFAFSAEGTTSKILKKITWNAQGLDLEEQAIPRVNRQLAPGAAAADPGLCRFFDYECYSVVTHMGSTLANGHYIAYVRNPQPASPFDWYKCSDANVVRVKIGSGDADDAQDRMFLDQKNHTPYLLFFQRKAERPEMAMKGVANMRGNF